jgi:hypothetical protein
MEKFLSNPHYFIENQHEKPFLGSIISAGASLIGGVLSNKSNKREAETSRDFTREQLQNQHQWQVEDLRKAGLNPILSAGGGGAGVGGSAQATVQNPTTDAVTNALSSLRLEEEINNLKADTTKKTNEAQKASADRDLSYALMHNAQQQFRKSEAAADLGDILSETSEKAKRLSHSAASAARTSVPYMKMKFKGFKPGPNKFNPGMNLKN